MSVLLIIFLVSVFVQLFYYGYFFLNLAKYKESPVPPNYNFPRVSVIVCAHNEEKNIRKNLHYVLRQVYSNDYEVILVDDASTDGTEQAVKELQLKYPQLRYIKNNKTLPGKKQALQLGVSQAKFNHLLFTDADCYPASNKWMENMISKYSNPSVQIVLGYSPYIFEKETFLSLVVQYETAMTAVQYLSFALRGKAYMGVGRNLSYKKEIFNENFFKNHEHLASGDDDLFIHQTATKNNVAIALNSKSFTLSQVPNSWKSWFRQKVRHYTTGFEYKPQIKLLLGLFLFSKLAFYVLVIPLLTTLQYIHIAIISFFLFIWLIKWVVRPIYKKLGASGILINISAFIDIFWIFSLFTMSLASLFRSKKRW